MYDIGCSLTCESFRCRASLQLQPVAKGCETAAGSQNILSLKRGVGGTRALTHSGDASPFRGVAKRIALATRGRADAADPFEIQSAGVFTFLGVWGGKKDVKIQRVLEVLVGCFLSLFA